MVYFCSGAHTSVTDAAGSLTRTYEERGDLAKETRVNGGTTLATGYTYDGASRIASMRYPDGMLVTYKHDAAGYVSAVTAQLPGASAATNLATLSHLPFGPMNGLTYGNGVAETRMYDNDYRAMSIIDTLSGVTGQNLTYVYDNANNVKSITDAVNPSNSQTLGYDAINRLTSATSGTGGYGGFTWTYDKVGNRQTQIQGSVTTTYSYTPGSNRLIGISAAVTSASLSAFPLLHRRIEIIPGQTSPVFASVVEGSRTTRPTEPAESSKPSLAVLFGWPMLLTGVVGIAGFRKRLLTQKWFGAFLLAMLAMGSARLLIGCGGSGGSSLSPVSPAPTPTPTAATPTFSVATGTYAAPQAVTISDTTTGSTIYYTTDGSTPSTGSTKYASPVTISASETLSAIAVASGYTNSAVGQAVYKIDTSVSGPVSSDSSGNITSLPVFVDASSSASTDADRRAYVAMASTLGTATAAFTYNNANRLASVTGTPLAATFVYDWSGQRFSKTNPGSPAILYSYMQGGTLIAENDNGSVTDYVYADGRPIAVLQPGASTTANQVNYVHTDRLGTPQVVTDSSGSSVWATTYQPFGTTGIINAAINQDLRLPGQNFDAETGFNYNLNRDYVPYLGRYLESDPIGLDGGINTYLYVMANPFRRADRTGLQYDELLAPVAQPLEDKLFDYFDELSLWIDENGPEIMNSLQNYSTQVASKLTSSNLYEAATQEGSAANMATGMICGSVKGEFLPPNFPAPTFGNDFASQAMEAIIEANNDLADELDYEPARFGKAQPFPSGKMSYPAPNMSFPLFPNPQ